MGGGATQLEQQHMVIGALVVEHRAAICIGVGVLRQVDAGGGIAHVHGIAAAVIGHQLSGYRQAVGRVGGVVACHHRTGGTGPLHHFPTYDALAGCRFETAVDSLQGQGQAAVLVGFARLDLQRVFHIVARVQLAVGNIGGVSVLAETGRVVGAAIIVVVSEYPAARGAVGIHIRGRQFRAAQVRGFQHPQAVTQCIAHLGMGIVAAQGIVVGILGLHGAFHHG